MFEMVFLRPKFNNFLGEHAPRPHEVGLPLGLQLFFPPCEHHLYTFKISSYAPRNITFQVYLIKSLDKTKFLNSTSLLMQQYSLYFAAQVI